jgi:hypothetical protein
MRILGWLATIVGVVGIVGCLAVAVGAWVVRPAVTDRAHEIVAIVDNGLQKTSELTDVATTRLTTVSEKLGSITSILDSVADSPLVDTAVGTAVRDAISGFVEGPYANLKADVSGLRERVLSIADVVTQLDAAIPGIELPGVVTDTITDVDARLTSLDSTVQSVNQVAGNGVTTSEQITQLSTQVGEIQQVVDTVVPALGTAKTQIGEAQVRLDTTSDRIDSTINWVAIIVTIVFIYLALLNVLLYQQGRRWLAAAKAGEA